MSKKNPTIKPTTRGQIKPLKVRGLTTQQTHLASEIKRINQRIVELEKRGYTGTQAYRKIVGAKYGKENIITTKQAGIKTPTSKGTAGGGLKIRTDVKNMTQAETQAVEQLIKDFTSVPSTISEIKKVTKDIQQYYKEEEQIEYKEEEITDDMIQEYLDDVDDVTADAIATAFYTKEYGFSDMYIRSLNGEKYADLKQEVINKLVFQKRFGGWQKDENAPFDEDLLNMFYSDDDYEYDRALTTLAKKGVKV
jgi:hypothetical protein